MKNSIIGEIRKHRMAHTQRFGSDLHRICEDLRKTEQHLADRLVKRSPRRLTGTGGPEQMMVAEESAKYHVRPKTGS